MARAILTPTILRWIVVCALPASAVWADGKPIGTNPLRQYPTKPGAQPHKDVKQSIGKDFATVQRDARMISAAEAILRASQVLSSLVSQGLLPRPEPVAVPTADKDIEKVTVAIREVVAAEENRISKRTQMRIESRPLPITLPSKIRKGEISVKTKAHPLKLASNKLEAPVGDDLSDEERSRNFKRTIERLRLELSRKEDLDKRVKLAHYLAWDKQFDQARNEAKIVLAEAPGYVDVEILLARIDAWEGKYKASSKRLAKLAKDDPDNEQIVLAQADTALWGEDYSAARKFLRKLIRKKATSDLYLKLALVAEAQWNPLEAKRMAKKALKLDPENKRAKAFLESNHVASVDGSTSFDAVPLPDGRTAFGFGATVVGTLFPRGRWSASFGYDYARRFDTNNHRLIGRFDYRIAKPVTAYAVFRGGFVNVVPQFSLVTGVDLAFSKTYGFSVAYAADKMKWPGQFHRLRLAAATKGNDLITLGAQTELGLFRNCGKTDFAQNAMVHGALTKGKWESRLSYGYSLDLEKPPLPAFLQGRFGDGFCLSEEVLMQFPDAEETELVDLRAHVVGADVRWEMRKRTHLRAGYSISIRLFGKPAHVIAIGARHWF